MIRIILAVILCLSAFNGKSQLYLKNSTSKPIIVALGWHSESSDFNGYITKGWFTIEPNQTLNTGLSFSSTNDHFYYYAISKDKSNDWSGDNKLLVGSNNFLIKNADMDYKKQEDKSFSWKGFRRKDVSFGFLETKTYTLDFTSGLDYKYEETVVLKGVLEKITVIYDNRNLEGYILKLNNPINVYAPNKYYSTEKNVKEIHVKFEDNVDLNKFLGKQISIKGDLYNGGTLYDFRPIIVINPIIL
jgi:uncharacterized membrane protein